MTTRQRWTLVCTVIGSGAVFLDGTIVNAALKHIGQELPGTFVSVLEGQAYIVGGYLAVLAALLILSGALSDFYGRRRVYALGLIGFAATSALCGLAPTLEWLVIFRLAQGAAGALLIPGSLALITHAFDGIARARAFGIWAAATAALTILGPIVGGAIVDTVGWRVAFLINVPLLAFALWATLTHVAESRDTEATGRFDWLGAAVAALAVGGLAFGVIRGQANAWADPAAWVALGIGFVALVAFPILMARRPHPLVPLELFRSRAFSAVNLATFFIYGGLYVTFFYQAVILQGVLGYSALGAGLAGIPGGIMLALLSTRIGTLAGRLGARRFLVAGPLLMATGLLLVLAHPRRFGAMEGGSRHALEPHPAGRHADRRPALRAAVRPRDLVRRRTVDEHPDGLDLRPLFGGRLGHQQLDLASGPAAPGGPHLHPGECRLLRLAQRRDWARYRRRGHPADVPAAQSARHRGDGRPGDSLERGVHRRLPAGDVGLRRAARGRGVRVVVRPARTARRHDGLGATGPGGRSARRGRLTGRCRAIGTPGPTTASRPR